MRRTALLAGVQLLQGGVRQPFVPEVLRRSANPAPNMALIGTVLQQTFMRQLADLVAEP